MKILFFIFAVSVAQTLASFTDAPRETQIFGNLGQKTLLGVDYAFAEAKKGEVVEAIVQFPSVS